MLSGSVWKSVFAPPSCLLRLSDIRLQTRRFGDKNQAPNQEGSSQRVCPISVHNAAFLTLCKVLGLGNVWRTSVHLKRRTRA